MDRPAILGGKKIRTKPFSSRVTMGNEEKKAVMNVLDSDVLSAFFGSPGHLFLGGEQVKAFEKAWADKYGFKHAISVNSWTSGLIIGLGAVGVGPGDEVICSPYTMSASATCALFYGAIPIFADVDPHTYCLDPKSIEEKITKRTKAIVVVHLFGGAADMDGIMKVARKYDLKVIEDAAQAPGVFYKEKPVGAIGDIGGFSLNYHKHIHSGEGGMLVTNDDEIALRAQLIRNHGENCITEMKIENLSNVFGGNYRLTEIQSAIGIEQLNKLDMYLETRKELAGFVTNELSNIPALDVSQNDEDCNHAYYVYPMKFHKEEAGISRKLFVKAVLEELPDTEDWENVALAPGYIQPLYLNPIYQNKIAMGPKGFPFNYNEGVEYHYPKGLCPITERLYEKEMIISPIVREPLTIEDMADVTIAIKKVLDSAKEIQAAFPDVVDGGIVDYK